MGKGPTRAALAYGAALKDSTMTPTAETPDTSRRALSILARSLFQQMREQGYSSEQIIGLSSELIELVSHDLRQERAMDARWAAE